MRALLTSIVLQIPMVGSAQVQSYRETWNGQPAPRDEVLMRRTILQAQNRARAAYGSSPLVWNEALAANARDYAGALAREGRFVHDPQRGAFVRQGENLWRGTRDAFDYATMAANWIDEGENFRAGRFPNVSRRGYWTMVSHYTQIVWPATTSVGCAIVSNASDDYLVCRYLPAGNIFGTDMR